MPKIAVLESLTEPGQVWEVKRFPFKLGRAKTNDLVITSTKPLGEKPKDIPIKAYVSGYHAELRQVGQGYSIADLNSTNGTYLNGNRFKGESILKSGDTISLGNAYRLKFRTQENEVPSQPKTEQITISQTALVETEQ